MDPYNVLETTIAIVVHLETFINFADRFKKILNFIPMFKNSLSSFLKISQKVLLLHNSKNYVT